MALPNQEQNGGLFPCPKKSTGQRYNRKEKLIVQLLLVHIDYFTKITFPKELKRAVFFLGFFAREFIELF
jgi:hypothetical protein